MSATHNRFETREAINAAIAQLVAQGVPLDEVDVVLTQIGVVDLDLCVECLQEMAAEMQARAIMNSLEQSMDAA